MGLRWTEEDLKAYQARQKKQAHAEQGIPQGKAVAHLRGADFEPMIREKPPATTHHDEIDAYAYAMQAVEIANEAEAKVKRSKYGNRKVKIDGMKFDSQHEADIYFGTLLPSFKCGAYKFLARQVPFDLPGGIRYIADFVTVSADGHVSVIDAKSEATKKNRVYINKKKQVKAIWGIDILEV